MSRLQSPTGRAHDNVFGHRIRECTSFRRLGSATHCPGVSRDIQGPDVGYHCVSALKDHRSKANTGYRVTIRRKFHRFFQEMVFNRDAPRVPNAPDALDVRGNCIPAGLWHLMEALRAQIGTHLEAMEDPRNVKASERGVRTHTLHASCGISVQRTASLHPRSCIHPPFRRRVCAEHISHPAGYIMCT